MMMRRSWWTGLLVMVFVAGCSSDDSSGGGGASSGGASTGGKSSGGAGGGGTSGGGTSGGGTSGGGTSAGGGSAGAAPLAVALPCSDSASDVYVTPTGLPPFSATVRGEVVRCTTDPSVDAAAVTARLTELKIGMTATTGVKRYRIAYRTERAPGVEGVGTALVALPDPPPPGPLPIIVATHGTAGLADKCAPSKANLDYLVYPFAGTGLPVIAPDYAGLGNEGVQGYGDGVDTAHSTLDAARALRKLVTAGALSLDIIVTGHSQGGGAALNAQSAAKSYGADGTVRAVIPFAPGWQDSASTDVTNYKFANVIPTSLALGVPATVSALYAYADQYNGVGPANPGALFNAAVRSDIVSMIENDCVLGIALQLPNKAANYGALFDQAFLDGVVSCIETSTCNEPAKSFLARVAAHYQPIDASGAQILIVQGLKDGQATPERTACYVNQMTSTGITPTVCTDADATHFNVVDRNIPYVRDWVGALISGGTLPTCPSTQPLPACKN